MKTRAIQRNVHVSPRKAKLVCDLIRNKKVTEALTILEYCNKKIAIVIYKLLNQAIANATNNHAMNGEKLYVYSVVANQGHTLKRTFPRAKGSADLIKKRHSHLEIIVSDDLDERKKDVQKIKDVQKKRALNNKGHRAVQMQQLKALKDNDKNNVILKKPKKVIASKKPNLIKEKNVVAKKDIKKVIVTKSSSIEKKENTKKVIATKPSSIEKKESAKKINSTKLQKKIGEK